MTSVVIAMSGAFAAFPTPAVAMGDPIVVRKDGVVAWDGAKILDWYLAAKAS